VYKILFLRHSGCQAAGTCAVAVASAGQLGLRDTGRLEIRHFYLATMNFEIKIVMLIVMFLFFSFLFFFSSFLSFLFFLSFFLILYGAPAMSLT